MQASFEMPEGKDRLRAILSTFPSNSAHWNEAQNRFQFVDRLLAECLGWEKPDIEVEPREHFLASMIVAFLSAVNIAADKDGYVPGEKIIAEMLRHGFVEDQTRFALRRVATKRLIETPHGHFRELPVQESIVPEDFPFRATSIGIYHLRHWTGSFGYLDAVSIDTPIFDQEVREKISRLAESFEIVDRLKKAELFRGYLEAQWDTANIRSGYYDFNGLVGLQRDTFASVRRVGRAGGAKRH